MPKHPMAANVANIAERMDAECRSFAATSPFTMKDVLDLRATAEFIDYTYDWAARFNVAPKRDDAQQVLGVVNDLR